MKSDIMIRVLCHLDLNMLGIYGENFKVLYVHGLNFGVRT